MLNKDYIINKMKERGFTVYSSNNKVIHFVSSRMYDTNYERKVKKRDRIPIINIIVYIDSEEFECRYNISEGINYIATPKCGSVLSDEHFDNIVGNFENDAKWIERLHE